MARFQVLANGVLIGHSELESGDPPMGVAEGRFLPSPSYAAIQPSVVATRYGSQAHLMLSVRSSNGTHIPAQGGVQILDYSGELTAEEIEVHVLGVGYPAYEE